MRVTLIVEAAKGLHGNGRASMGDWHMWEFDVANYGDLLFPLIAESELTERLGAVTLHRFSYNARTPPDWPYEVTSITKLPETSHRLDGLERSLRCTCSMDPLKWFWPSCRRGNGRRNAGGLGMVPLYCHFHQRRHHGYYSGLQSCRLGHRRGCELHI
jgi:hypothetical protein